MHQKTLVDRIESGARAVLSFYGLQPNGEAEHNPLDCVSVRFPIKHSISDAVRLLDNHADSRFVSLNDQVTEDDEAHGALLKGHMGTEDGYPDSPLCVAEYYVMRRDYQRTCMELTITTEDGETFATMSSYNI